MDSDTTGAPSPQHVPVGRADSPSTGGASELLRHVRLDTGHELRTWDTGRTRGTGMMARTRIGYELRDPKDRVLFAGDDFGPSPMHADDSDATLRALCRFLFLRPGDTDRNYFANYTPAQLAFAESSECDLLAFLYSDDPAIAYSAHAGRFVDVADGEGAGR